MNKLLLVPTVFGTALLVGGCGESALVAPGVTSQPALLTVPTEISVTATVPLTLTVAGDVSVRPNGTLIQRGFVLQGPISGDLDSDADDAVVVTGSLILDVAGSGGAQGSLTITACHDDLGCGTFQGAFNGKFSAGLFGDVLRMRGTGGAFVGRILTGTFQEAGPPPGENVYTIAATIQ